MNATHATAASKLNFLSENERHLEKLRQSGKEVRSFDGWKQVGKWVRKGEKMKAFTVRNGVVRRGIDPITGEDRYEAKLATCYGFTADQVR